ncbi:hypothetical protein RFI_03698 [Reticulomyxa filosa]|uniref:Uncharacterized protein n=1 Tax=Reticulomyxa filosa TaxID=46433 RepID=X6P5Q5_RETFI|nr:hypothetical protein RFI_03698 [Reticulomyxa filosa]|eukprot:ETO33409.1 hypothetical protein RFI_03698 [Reticulomyxa filosa]
MEPYHQKLEICMNFTKKKFCFTDKNALKNNNFYVYNYRLSGELPRLDILPSLITVELNSNMLSGTIPFHDSYDWDRLIMFSLERNMFSGNLPKLPNRMHSTLILTLHMNQFSDHNLHDWLDELFQKAPALQILSIYDNPHLTGHLPNSLYNTNVEMFLAHGCEINGVLPSSNVQGNIRFATLLQNRLSGAMPSSLIQTADVKNTSLMTIFNDSALLLSFDVDTNLKNGLYLQGNRFSESAEWYQIFQNRALPKYVSNGERNAKTCTLQKKVILLM